MTRRYIVAVVVFIFVVTFLTTASFAHAQNTSVWEQVIQILHNISALLTQLPSQALVAQIVPASPGLVAAYSFDEGSGTTVTDTSGNDNTGSFLGGPLWATGHTGNALTLDGVSAMIAVPNASLLGLTTAFTMEGWAFPTSGTHTLLMAKENFQYDLFTNQCGFSGATFGGVFYTPLTLNTWSHLACTYDGTTLTVYVNGVQVASRAQTGSVPTSTGVLHLGGTTSSSGKNFIGTLDDFRLYNRALSQAEIQTDMNTPVGGGSPPSPPPDTTPPTLSAGSPSGSLAAGTTQTTLQLTTDESATCKYGTIANTAYTSISNTFTTTGGTSHSAPISGLTNGQSYTYYVRCQDTAGNPTTNDFPLSFSIASAAVIEVVAVSPWVTALLPELEREKSKGGGGGMITLFTVIIITTEVLVLLAAS